MNNNCINFKKRTKTKNKKVNIYFYCTNSRKEIQYKDCKNCKGKEYKVYKPMKQRTTRLSKLERKRVSLFTEDLEYCYLCPNKKDHMHEIYCGRNRKNSMIYNLCIPICVRCHSKYQDNKEFNDLYHKKGQALFNETYPDLKFEDIFKINYL